MSKLAHLKPTKNPILPLAYLCVNLSVLCVKKNNINLAIKTIAKLNLPFLLSSCYLLLSAPVLAMEPYLRVIVNSDRDGSIQPDNVLTLREAIEIVNGTLPLEKLSNAEKNQILAIASSSGIARIEFNLPQGNTTIRLVEQLPPLSVPVIIDGTTQPGYSKSSDFSVLSSKLRNSEAINYLENLEAINRVSTTQNSKFITQNYITKPVVAIAPAPDREIMRGLVVVSDNVTIRGLSLYGFTSRHRATASTPPADILIASTSNDRWVLEKDEINYSDTPPKNVVIESNFLGILPGEEDRNTANVEAIAQSNRPITRANRISGIMDVIERYFTTPPAILSNNSAFGVYVFNSLGTTIRRNVIANHDGSGIITAANAKNLLIEENILERNGFGGMPDAIRLEGNISNTQIVSNQIRDNAGSGIYLFKPKGSVQIRENTINNNGREFRRAAVYLMGDEHQAIDNQIANQNGPGVVVAAFPNSDRNIITGNQFSNLQGLSIDLVTQLNTDVHAYAVGDGPNPRTNSYQRRRKTANFGIDAPRFISREFFLKLEDKTIALEGSAQPDSIVEIYRVTEESNALIGPLNQAIATTQVNKDGQFSISIGDLQPGEQVSATATHPEYGTSEPARNAVVRSLPSILP